VQDEVLEVEFALEPEGGAGFAKMGAGDPAVAHEAAGEALVETGKDVLRASDGDRRSSARGIRRLGDRARSGDHEAASLGRSVRRSDAEMVISVSSDAKRRRLSLHNSIRL
jgi:hypothetical protein